MVRIGPAGWAYKDWNGIDYPSNKPKGFNPVGYLAQYFDTIEINSSFYGPPRPSAAKAWAERVQSNQRFRFTAKVYQAFTHARNATPQDERDFKEGIEPLMSAGRFGGLLLQFPWSFKLSPENRAYLIGLQRRFSDYPLVVEVRHASWLEHNILDLFSELNIGICNIDQPLFKRSVKPAAYVTSAIGYVRLHGRNYQNWFSKDVDVRERYDHLYSLDELEPWVARTRQISEDAADTYVVANDHYLGKAAVNAVEIGSILQNRPATGPPQLVQHYPELAQFIATEDQC